jgi:hypothetical protein
MVHPEDLTRPLRPKDSVRLLPEQGGALTFSFCLFFKIDKAATGFRSTDVQSCDMIVIAPTIKCCAGLAR